MNPELEKNLVNKYPLLFKGTFGPVNKTCMHFGFECGDGWYGIIDELSSKLEPLVEDTLDNNVCMCGETKDNHENSTGRCTIKYDVPFSLRINHGYLAYHDQIDTSFKSYHRRVKFRLLTKINGVGWKLSRLLMKYGVCKKKPSACEGFDPYHVKCAQVKEKFGTLRFYMHSATEEMYDLISKAEQKTETTCEVCGEEGKVRSGGWIVTLCDKHYKDRNTSKEPV